VRVFRLRLRPSASHTARFPRAITMITPLANSPAPQLKLAQKSLGGFAPCQAMIPLGSTKPSKSQPFSSQFHPILDTIPQQKRGRNHGGYQLNPPHHNPPLDPHAPRHPAPHPRAHRRTTNPPPQPSKSAPAKAPQTTPRRPKPPHNSNTAEQSHLPLRQSSPPFSLPLLVTPQSRASAKRSQTLRPAEPSTKPLPLDARICTRMHGSSVFSRPA
jgi:hypothetical protein